MVLAYYSVCLKCSFTVTCLSREQEFVWALLIKLKNKAVLYMEHMCVVDSFIPLH